MDECKPLVAGPEGAAAKIESLERELRVRRMRALKQMKHADVASADTFLSSWLAAQGGSRGLHSSTFQLDLSRFSHLLVSPCLIDWGKPMHQTYPTKCAYVEPKSERV